MRTIKFRGLRTNEPNTWVYGFYIEHADGSCSITHPSFTVIKETVGQFTGLFDKQGKDIYEGDIMKVSGNSWALEHNTSVIFHDGKFVTDFFNYKIDCQDEVIGNIYENKDLLK
jgi:hypothetical protein